MTVDLGKQNIVLEILRVFMYEGPNGKAIGMGPQELESLWANLIRFAHNDAETWQFPRWGSNIQMTTGYRKLKAIRPDLAEILTDWFARAKVATEERAKAEREARLQAVRLQENV